VREQHDVDALAVRAHVSREQDVVTLAGAAVEAFATIEILVNNAGATLGRPSSSTRWRSGARSRST
jgi:NAD(P)-dependent dehydrogenase (short-subunit alcohol dehydrogenase family)